MATIKLAYSHLDNPLGRPSYRFHPLFLAIARDPAETRLIIHKIRVLERSFLHDLNIQQHPPLLLDFRHHTHSNQPCRHPGSDYQHSFYTRIHSFFA